MKVYQATIYQLKEALEQAEKSQDLELIMALTATMSYLHRSINQGVDIKEVIRA